MSRRVNVGLSDDGRVTALELDTDSHLPHVFGLYYRATFENQGICRKMIEPLRLPEPRLWYTYATS